MRWLGLRQGVLNTEQIILNHYDHLPFMINILIYSVIYLKKEGLKIIVSAVQEINLLDLNLGIDFKFKYMYVLVQYSVQG